MIPRLVIAGAASGVGKTTITAGVVAALRSRGLRVQPFKCGPDYIDPSYHAVAAGVPCRNLDTWMISKEALLDLFARATRSADIAIVEGVMGFYDGRNGLEEAGSTAEIAKTLDAPVILILNVDKTARSAGAMALGYKEFDRNVRLAGVILNRTGSQNHLRWTKEAVEAATGIPVVGYLPKNADLHLPERHLGLVPTSEGGEMIQRIGSIRQQVEATVDVDKLITICRAAPVLEWPNSAGLFLLHDEGSRIRLAVARDEAFSFYYEDNLDILRAWGAEIVFVSPVHDSQLGDVDGLYVGGGFPEVYAAQLSENRSFIHSIRMLAEAGLPIYAECGGLMYLSEGIVDFEGSRYPMVGLVPGWSQMQSKRVRMGYVSVEALADSILANKGQELRGHEFHWSKLQSFDGKAAYRVVGGDRVDGFAERNILASYVHLHFGTDVSLARRLIAACEAWRSKR